MEIYSGVKFRCVRIGEDFAFDEKLAELNSWAFVLAELGLTPVHAEGAFGNLSYREGEGAMVITKTGMVPSEALLPENYVLVERVDDDGTLFYRGTASPSSESILHHAVYRVFPDAQAVFHGHSKLLERNAAELSIPVTTDFHPYGTSALAVSAVELLRKGGNFIFLRNHGFVATGAGVRSVGNLVIAYYERLVRLLRR